MRNSLTTKIICVVVAILFFVNDICWGLAPTPASRNIPVQDKILHVATSKLYDAKIASSDFVELLSSVVIGNAPGPEFQFIKVDRDNLPEEWNNNPILKQINPVDAANYFMNNEAKISSSLLTIKEGYVERSKNKRLSFYKIYEITDNKETSYKVVFDTRFVQILSYIMQNDIWFKDPHDSNRVKSVAYEILYHVLRKLTADLRSKGLPIKDQGLISFSLDTTPSEKRSNYDPAWKWFLFSYCSNNSIRCNNDNLIKIRQLARNKAEAKVVCAINYKFFSQPGIKLTEPTVDQEFKDRYYLMQYMVDISEKRKSLSAPTAYPGMELGKLETERDKISKLLGDLEVQRNTLSRDMQQVLGLNNACNKERLEFLGNIIGILSKNLETINRETAQSSRRKEEHRPRRKTKFGKSSEGQLELIARYRKVSYIISAPILRDLYMQHWEELDFDEPTNAASVLRTAERDLFEKNNSLLEQAIVREIKRKGSARRFRLTKKGKEEIKKLNKMNNDWEGAVKLYARTYGATELARFIKYELRAVKALGIIENELKTTDEGKKKLIELCNILKKLLREDSKSFENKRLNLKIVQAIIDLHSGAATGDDWESAVKLYARTYGATELARFIKYELRAVKALGIIENELKTTSDGRGKLLKLCDILKKSLIAKEDFADTNLTLDILQAIIDLHSGAATGDDWESAVKLYARTYGATELARFIKYEARAVKALGIIEDKLKTTDKGKKKLIELCDILKKSLIAKEDFADTNLTLDIVQAIIDQNSNKATGPAPIAQTGAITRESPETITLNIINRVLEKDVIEMLFKAGSGHPGGSLSMLKMLTALYFGTTPDGKRIMRYDPRDPNWKNRDRFVLSKGHAAPGLYAALGRAGFFPTTEFNNLRKFGSILQGHSDMTKTRGVDMSAGSIGVAFSTAVGMALAAKMDNRDYTTYVMLGDGETQEGQVDEAARHASAMGLDNIVAFLDWNGMQIDGKVTDVDVDYEGQVRLWEARGWNVIKADGSDMADVIRAIDAAKTTKNGKPTIIITKTKKGAGFKGMDKHGAVPKEPEVTAALDIINKNLSELAGESFNADTYIKDALTKVVLGKDDKEKIDRANKEACQARRAKLLDIIKTENAKGIISGVSQAYPQDKKVATRTANGDELVLIGVEDPDVVLMSADLKGSVMFEKFAQAFGTFSANNPTGRYIPAGIREAHMVSMAAGLATCGKIPVIGTFSIFTTRMVDQLNAILNTKLPIIIVGTHGGLATGPDGRTHQDAHSQGVLGALPNVSLYEGADAEETRVLTRHIYNTAKKYGGIHYIRPARLDTAILPKPQGWQEGAKRGFYTIFDSESNKGKQPEKYDVGIVSTGVLGAGAIEAAGELAAKGKRVRVVNVTQLKAITNSADNIAEFAKLIDCENLISVIDALPEIIGDRIDKVLVDKGLRPKYITNLGIDKYGESGTPEQLYALHGLDKNGILKAALGPTAPKSAAEAVSLKSRELTVGDIIKDFKQPPELSKITKISIIAQSKDYVVCAYEMPGTQAWSIVIYKKNAKRMAKFQKDIIESRTDKPTAAILSKQQLIEIKYNQGNVPGTERRMSVYDTKGKNGKQILDARLVSDGGVSGALKIEDKSEDYYIVYIVPAKPLRKPYYWVYDLKERQKEYIITTSMPKKFVNGVMKTIGSSVVFKHMAEKLVKSGEKKKLRFIKGILYTRLKRGHAVDDKLTRPFVEKVVREALENNAKAAGQTGKSQKSAKREQGRPGDDGKPASGGQAVSVKGGHAPAVVKNLALKLNEAQLAKYVVTEPATIDEIRAIVEIIENTLIENNKQEKLINFCREIEKLLQDAPSVERKTVLLNAAQSIIRRQAESSAGQPVEIPLLKPGESIKVLPEAALQSLLAQNSDLKDELNNVRSAIEKNISEVLRQNLTLDDLNKGALNKEALDKLGLKKLKADSLKYIGTVQPYVTKEPKRNISEVYTIEDAEGRVFAIFPKYEVSSYSYYQIGEPDAMRNSIVETSQMAMAGEQAKDINVRYAELLKPAEYVNMELPELKAEQKRIDKLKEELVKASRDLTRRIQDSPPGQDITGMKTQQDKLESMIATLDKNMTEISKAIALRHGYHTGEGLGGGWDSQPTPKDNTAKLELAHKTIEYSTNLDDFISGPVAKHAEELKAVLEILISNNDDATAVEKIKKLSLQELDAKSLALNYEGEYDNRNRIVTINSIEGYRFLLSPDKPLKGLKNVEQAKQFKYKVALAGTTIGSLAKQIYIAYLKFCNLSKALATPSASVRSEDSRRMKNEAHALSIHLRDMINAIVDREDFQRLPLIENVEDIRPNDLIIDSDPKTNVHSVLVDRAKLNNTILKTHEVRRIYRAKRLPFADGKDSIYGEDAGLDTRFAVTIDNLMQVAAEKYPTAIPDVREFIRELQMAGVPILTADDLKKAEDAGLDTRFAVTIDNLMQVAAEKYPTAIPDVREFIRELQMAGVPILTADDLKKAIAAPDVEVAKAGPAELVLVTGISVKETTSVAYGFDADGREIFVEFPSGTTPEKIWGYNLVYAINSIWQAVSDKTILPSKLDLFVGIISGTDNAVPTKSAFIQGVACKMAEEIRGLKVVSDHWEDETYDVVQLRPATWVSVWAVLSKVNEMFFPKDYILNKKMAQIKEWLLQKSLGLAQTNPDLADRLIPLKASVEQAAREFLATAPFTADDIRASATERTRFTVYKVEKTFQQILNKSSFGIFSGSRFQRDKMAQCKRTFIEHIANKMKTLSEETTIGKMPVAIEAEQPEQPAEAEAAKTTEAVEKTVAKVVHAEALSFEKQVEIAKKSMDFDSQVEIVTEFLKNNKLDIDIEEHLTIDKSTISLNLSMTHIADISALAGLANLTTLNLYCTNITDEQIYELFAAHPNPEKLTVTDASDKEITYDNVLGQAAGEFLAIGLLPADIEHKAQQYKEGKTRIQFDHNLEMPFQGVLKKYGFNILAGFETQGKQTIQAAGIFLAKVAEKMKLLSTAAGQQVIEQAAEAGPAKSGPAETLSFEEQVKLAEKFLEEKGLLETRISIEDSKLSLNLSCGGEFRGDWKNLEELLYNNFDKITALVSKLDWLTRLDFSGTEIGYPSIEKLFDKHPKPQNLTVISSLSGKITYTEYIQVVETITGDEQQKLRGPTPLGAINEAAVRERARVLGPERIVDFIIDWDEEVAEKMLLVTEDELKSTVEGRKKLIEVCNAIKARKQAPADLKALADTVIDRNSPQTASRSFAAAVGEAAEEEKTLRALHTQNEEVTKDEPLIRIISTFEVPMGAKAGPRVTQLPFEELKDIYRSADLSDISPVEIIQPQSFGLSEKMKSAINRLNNKNRVKIREHGGEEIDTVTVRMYLDEAGLKKLLENPADPRVKRIVITNKQFKDDEDGTKRDEYLKLFGNSDNLSKLFKGVKVVNVILPTGYGNLPNDSDKKTFHEARLHMIARLAARLEEKSDIGKIILKAMLKDYINGDVNEFVENLAKSDGSWSVSERIKYFLGKPVSLLSELIKEFELLRLRMKTFYIAA